MLPFFFQQLPIISSPILQTWLKYAPISKCVYPVSYIGKIENIKLTRYAILLFLAVRGSPFYYNHPSSSPINLSKFMPNATTDEHATREPGTLLDSEVWWRDHSKVLENHGYRLRPRYRPDWVPSWKKSGKEFYTVEDGQPTLVSFFFFHLMPFHP